MKQAEETAVAVATEGADLLTVGNEPELKAISDGIGELLRMGPVSEGAGEEAVVEGEVRVPLLEDRYLQIYEVHQKIMEYKRGLEELDRKEMETKACLKE